MARTMYRTTLRDERDNYTLYDFPHHSRFMRDVITVGDLLGTNRVYGPVVRVFCNQQGVAVSAIIKIGKQFTSYIDLDDATDFDSWNYGQPCWEEYYTGDELREIWGDEFPDDDDGELESHDAFDDDDDWGFEFEECPEDDEDDEDRDIIIEEGEEEE